MSSVGNFPGIAHATKIIRMPANPLDKSTIVSIYPKQVRQVSPTIYPGVFTIEAAPDNGFELLVVGTSSWYKEMEEGQPYLEIPTSSIVMAQSIIVDYCNGLFCCDMGDVMPGLFFIPGEWTKQTITKYVSPIMTTFSDMMEGAKVKQKNYFMEVVRQADVMWARTSGNPLSISDEARMAASKLNLQKNWMADFKAMELKNCPACGSMVNPLFPICSNCKTVINAAKAKELGLEFAK